MKARKIKFKYGRGIIKKTLDQIPFNDYRFSNRSEYEIRLWLIRIIWRELDQNNKDGRFGLFPYWKIKIHFKLKYGLLHYYPEWPSKKHSICIKYGKRWDIR